MAGYTILDKLTRRARRIVVQSRIMAGGGSVSPKEFLGFLRREKGGVATKVLGSVNEGKVWEWKTGSVAPLELLEAAYDEARRLGHSYVGTEHLLLGLVRLGSPDNLEKIRRRVARAASFPVRILSEEAADSTPLLDAFGTDITSLAGEGKLEPVVGRESVLSRIVNIFLRRERNNPLLVGEPGVGKMAVVRGLAIRISRSEVPAPLLSKRVVHLHFPRLLASFSYRGDIGMGFSSLLEEARAAGNTILFIDEFHTLMGGGFAAGVSPGVVNVLKEALTSGGVQFLGATTPNGYRRYLEFDQILTGRLAPVLVPESTEEETEEVLKVLASKFEKFHGVKYSPAAIHQAVVLSRRHLTDQFLPDKALDILDESGAWVRAKGGEMPVEFRESLSEFRAASRELSRALDGQDLDHAVNLRSRRELLRRKVESFSPQREERLEVDKEVVASVVSDRTGIPLTRLRGPEERQFKDIEKILGENVVGQYQAIRALAKALRRRRVGLADPRRPIGSFLFLGPTGVGKTELARALADFLFGSSRRLVRFDMSEFRERHTTARLIGAPPGYIGYDHGGELTERVRQNPYSVVLFDEMEKAHPEVLNLLLQIMEEGELRDGQGKVADFRNTVVILTSNVGADLLKRDELGFAAGKAPSSAYEGMRRRLLEDLKREVRPEFLNRLTEVLVFRPLGRKDVLEIVDLRLSELKERLSSKGLQMEVTAGAKRILAEKGYSEEYGARPLQRAIENEIETPLSEKIIRGEVSEGGLITVGVRGGKVVIRGN